MGARAAFGPDQALSVAGGVASVSAPRTPLCQPLVARSSWALTIVLHWYFYPLCSSAPTALSRVPRGPTRGSIPRHTGALRGRRGPSGAPKVKHFVNSYVCMNAGLTVIGWRARRRRAGHRPDSEASAQRSPESHFPASVYSPGSGVVKGPPPHLLGALVGKRGGNALCRLRSCVCALCMSPPYCVTLGTRCSAL